MSKRHREQVGGREAVWELASCMACGQLCEITGSFAMSGSEGLEQYVRTRCVLGHLMMGPAFALRPAAE